MLHRSGRVSVRAARSPRRSATSGGSSRPPPPRLGPDHRTPSPPGTTPRAGRGPSGDPAHPLLPGPAPGPRRGCGRGGRRLRRPARRLPAGAGRRPRPHPHHPVPPASWTERAGDPASATTAFAGLLEDWVRLLGAAHPGARTVRAGLAHARGTGVGDERAAGWRASPARPGPRGHAPAPPAPPRRPSAPDRGRVTRPGDGNPAPGSSTRPATATHRWRLDPRRSAGEVPPSGGGGPATRRMVAAAPLLKCGDQWETSPFQPARPRQRRPSTAAAEHGRHAGTGRSAATSGPAQVAMARGRRGPGPSGGIRPRHLFRLRGATEKEVGW